MAIPGRLELPTYCLEGSCSIQLSYGTVFRNIVNLALGDLYHSWASDAKHNQLALYRIISLAVLNDTLSIDKSNMITQTLIDGT